MRPGALSLSWGSERGRVEFDGKNELGLITEGCGQGQGGQDVPGRGNSL